MGVVSVDDVAVGAAFEQVVVDNLTRTQIVQYAGASGDFNPLHTDEIFVTRVAGFPTVFAHGMLTMGMTGKMLTDTFGAGSLIRFGGRFRAQVWPGDTLTARAEITDVSSGSDGHLVEGEVEGEVELEVAVATTNQDGREVFAGTATVRLTGVTV